MAGEQQIQLGIKGMGRAEDGWKEISPEQGQSLGGGGTEQALATRF